MSYRAVGPAREAKLWILPVQFNLREKTKRWATERLDRLGEQDSGFSTFSSIWERSAKAELLSGLTGSGRKTRPLPRVKATVLEWAIERLHRVREQEFSRISITSSFGIDQSYELLSRWTGWVSKTLIVPQRLKFASHFYRITALVRLKCFYWIDSRAAALFDLWSVVPGRGQKTSQKKKLLCLKVGVVFSYSRYWKLLLID